MGLLPVSAMLLALAAASFALTLQVKVTAKTNDDSTGQKDASIQVSVRTRAERGDEGRRIPVTEQHMATAYKDPDAREMLRRARASRLSQDSALIAYDAMAYQRMSAGLGFSKIGRERLAFRTENASRVRWHRDVGVWVDVKGARTAIPIVTQFAAKKQQREIAEDMADEADDMVVLPYTPGHETLFIGSGMVKADVNEEDLIHPLAKGSEAYYTYSTGDSASFRLPDRTIVRIRELEIRPREVRWNVVVGSLWFDADRGQLVRAAYRMAKPLDVWAIVEEDERREGTDEDDDVPGWVKGMMSPMRGQVRAVAVEYGLYGGRFWLPRLQYAEGDAQAGFVRVPFKIEMSYKYASVNGRDSLPPLPIARNRVDPDTLSDSARVVWRDSVRTARRASRDSVAQGLKLAEGACDSSGTRTVMRSRGGGENRVRVAMRIPCDVELLAKSPDLPPSIYDAGEEVFSAKDREALVEQALTLGAQPQWNPQRPRVHSSLEYVRYNRVEGISGGVLVDSELGKGYTASAFGRIGVADLEPNLELTFARTDLLRTVRVRGYNRLVTASDWGNPLSFGSSLSAMLFGRDEGLYYRTSGAELSGSRLRTSGAPWIEWRLFAERQRSANRETDWSVAGDFETPDLPVNPGQFAGGGIRFVTSRGLDPRGFRLFTDTRLEGAAADTGRAIGYGRAAFDATIVQGLGPLAAAITLAGGSSLGELPVQRHWYLGGAHTVRGQKPAAASGEAFWLARAEIGRDMRTVRAIIFGDMGWAGRRNAWQDVGVPLSGAGAGVSMLDGLIRFDVARGINPGKEVRVDMYVEAKF
jgi:hypothetical protein